MTMVLRKLPHGQYGRLLFLAIGLVWRTVSAAAAADAADGSASPAHLKPALESIATNDLLKHIRTLASDEFEGRAPATKGEDLTVQYLVEQFKAMGLQPGNPD